MTGAKGCDQWSSRSASSVACNGRNACTGQCLWCSRVFGWIAQLGAGFAASLVLIAGALLYEHRHAASRDVVAINRAFFSSNAFVGVVFLAGIVVDCIVPQAGANIPNPNVSQPETDPFAGSKAGDEREVGGVKLCWCPAGKFRWAVRATNPSDVLARIRST